MSSPGHRVFFLLPHVEIRGGNKTVFEIADRLAGRGHHVYVLTDTGQPPDWMAVKTPIEPRERWRRRIAEDDIVVMTWDYDADYLLEVSGHKGYYVQHFVHLVEDIFRLPLDFFVSVSSYVQKHTLETYGVHSFLVLNGIDHTVFRPLPDIPRTQDRVMTLGWGSWKGGSDVEKAIGLVRAQGQPVDFVRASDLGPEEMAGMYRSSAVYVSGSWYEGFGLPLLEAMACGCAVATTDSKGIDDFAIDGETCLKVPPRDPEAMSKAILRLLRDPALRQQLAANGLAMAQRFAWGPSIDAWEDLLGLRTGRPLFLDPARPRRPALSPSESERVVQRVRQRCAQQRRRERLSRIKSAIHRAVSRLPWSAGQP